MLGRTLAATVAAGAAYVWSWASGQPALFVFGAERYPGELRLWGVLFRALVCLVLARVSTTSTDWAGVMALGFQLVCALALPWLELGGFVCLLGGLYYASANTTGVGRVIQLSPLTEVVAAATPGEEEDTTNSSSSSRRRKKPARRDNSPAAAAPSSSSSLHELASAAKQQGQAEQQSRLQAKLAKLRERSPSTSASRRTKPHS